MSNAPTPGPSRCVFGWALLCGLGWGIGAATAIAAAAAMLLPSNGPLGAALELATWTALIASFLAIFPIAPIAGVAGWLLYRSGVLTPVAYAAIGAFSAVIAPVLVAFLLEETMRYQSTVNYAVLSETGVQLILFGTAVAGAFGGFMGGRALQSARDFE